MAEQFATIDDYISPVPEDVQVILEDVRRTIRNAAPTAGETISYRLPTITLNGRYLVSFAARTRHIAIYPVPTVDQAFEQELAPYRTAKSTLRFPLGQPLPHDLIARVLTLLVRHRVDSGGCGGLGASSHGPAPTATLSSTRRCSPIAPPSRPLRRPVSAMSGLYDVTGASNIGGVVAGEVGDGGCRSTDQVPEIGVV